MSSPTGIWTGWNNAGFCSFFTKKEAEIPNKKHLLMVSRCFFIAGGGVLDAPRADAGVRPLQVVFYSAGVSDSDPDSAGCSSSGAGVASGAAASRMA